MKTSNMFYVPCRVTSGFFPTEFYVLVQGSAAYVNASLVRLSSPLPLNFSNEVPGFVLASLVEEQEGKALIELSGEPAVGGLRTWIPSKELQAA